ncbi:tRNA1(Val) (adenine(37)-N6)-methyltransferase [Arcticibacter sp.]|jgi:tRNA1Val (adenine37-N6)-methyltransferase|uniref:tRNA1(Val) (adenine(37)-N6)-methyltransferase n=1 Tax=Arcticibacter sp. TaxID=1872630 RepID=UPI00389093AA
MKNIFRFKQFSVDQSGCGMKINTDGVLLGALAGGREPERILDIGGGTGVISLMLAQRFPQSRVDAVEIDPSAAETARRNFATSPFADRLRLIDGSFQDYGERRDLAAYNLIVSNPPFFLNALKNPDHQKKLARHAEEGFFQELMQFAQKHLRWEGELWLILPTEAALKTRDFAAGEGFHLTACIEVRSFAGDLPHREILVFSRQHKKKDTASLIIYEAPKIYSEAYKDLLRDFLIIF